MLQFILKTIITAIVVVLIAEAGKRFTTVGAILASLPLTSILAFIWLYFDTRDTGKVTALSREIFWMVIPSLVFFVALPIALKHMKFLPSMLLSGGITSLAYFIWIFVIRKLGML